MVEFLCGLALGTIATLTVVFWTYILVRRRKEGTEFQDSVQSIHDVPKQKKRTMWD